MGLAYQFNCNQADVCIISDSDEVLRHFDSLQALQGPDKLPGAKRQMESEQGAKRGERP